MARSALRRVLPHPVLTLILILIWAILNSSISLGTIVFGTILGVLIPLATVAYWPDMPRGIRFGKLVSYTILVVWDILVANVQVAWIVMTKPNAKMQSKWVNIPLDIKTPEAITMLAGTITLTPGTVTADVSDEGHCLLVHALDAEDADAVRDDIKQRYEARLKEIFE